MRPKTDIHAADLYVLIEREFRRRRPAQCNACYVQLPYRVDRPAPDAPNWEVTVPPPCPHGCKALIEDMVSEFGLLYDLRPDDGNR